MAVSVISMAFDCFHFHVGENYCRLSILHFVRFALTGYATNVANNAPCIILEAAVL